MVLQGQFLERPTLIPVGDEVLEGLSHRGQHTPPLLILPPTPAEGGSMDHVVAAEVAWAAAMAKHPTLRFNFRGVGASQGAPGSGLGADATAALQLLIENTGCETPAVLAIGGSAPVALELLRARPGMGGLALVNPSEIDAAMLSGPNVPLLVILAEQYTRLARSEVSAAVNAANGQLEVIDDADPVFTRNLPQVGRTVARWLQLLRG